MAQIGFSSFSPEKVAPRFAFSLCIEVPQLSRLGRDCTLYTITVNRNKQSLLLIAILILCINLIKFREFNGRIILLRTLIEAFDVGKLHEDAKFKLVSLHILQIELIGVSAVEEATDDGREESWVE